MAADCPDKEGSGLGWKTALGGLGIAAALGVGIVGVAATLGSSSSKKDEDSWDDDDDDIIIDSLESCLFNRKFSYM